MASVSPREPEEEKPFLTPLGRPARWLVPVFYVLRALAFVADLYRDNMLAYGIIYVPLVATAVFHRSRSGLWILTGLTCLLVVVGAFVPLVNPDLPDLIGNRILSILAILATAAFVHHARVSQDRLAAQTRRAEAAERIKSEVLTNLSHEMRTPLHALLGLLSLMMADSRPDQREALARVRSGGKQLLDTMDNLIDLTQIDQRALRREAVNVSTLLRDAADSARSAADEPRIAIDLDGLTLAADGSEATACGDVWATRRILDNLIANAIRFAPPGDTVSVVVARSAGSVTASIGGGGLPPDLTRLFRGGMAELDELDENDMHAAGAIGLTLSNRLARRMNGRLTITSRPGAGATISLSLPAG
jgi:signal transduction histidine kinase